MCFRSVQNKMQESIHPERGKSTLNGGKGKEWPENESQEIIINRGTTYCLRNGRFSREFSQKKVISEIF